MRCEDTIDAASGPDDLVWHPEQTDALEFELCLAPRERLPVIEA